MSLMKQSLSRRECKKLERVIKLVEILIAGGRSGQYKLACQRVLLANENLSASSRLTVR